MISLLGSFKFRLCDFQFKLGAYIHANLLFSSTPHARIRRYHLTLGMQVINF